MPKSTKAKNSVTLTDEKGREHAFNVLEFFSAGKTPFALLQPARGAKNEVSILKVVLDTRGVPKAFEAPTDKEFQRAIEALDVEDDCCGGCGCGEGGGCCGDGHEHAAKAPRKAAAKKPAGKKAARTPARRR